MEIQITDLERAANVAFQVKQLLIQLQTQIKPQIINAITLIENGTEGLTKEDLSAALGKDVEKITKKLKSLSTAI